MPDLLIIPSDNQSLFQLEEIAKRKGFRAKSALDLKSAGEWLNLRNFQAILIDHAVSLPEQQKLAGALWSKEPLALFVVFDLDRQSVRPHREARLFGAEIARGEAALEQIEGYLDSVLAHEERKQRVAPDNFKVMIVEDLDSPRDIISMYVESLGFPMVSGFSSAKAAMQELEGAPDAYSCVLTDIRMPEVSGKELIAFVRDNPRLAHLPIIVLTAYGTVDCLIDCLVAGATGFLVKPPKKRDLEWELHRALRIVAHHRSPRLSSEEEAEAMRNLLMDRGFM